MDVNLITPGIYRQRSYDNLKTGKSQLPSHYRLSRIVSFPTSISNACDSLAIQSPNQNLNFIEQQKQQLILPSPPMSSKRNNLKPLRNLKNPNVNIGNYKNNVMPSSLAPLVPLHYKYFTPQSKINKNDELTARYFYHKNRVIPPTRRLNENDKKFATNRNNCNSLNRSQDFTKHKDDDDENNNNNISNNDNDDEMTPLNGQNDNCIKNKHFLSNDIKNLDQTASLLRPVVLSNDNVGIDPKLKQHHINYRIHKENMRNSNKNILLKKGNRYSNIYEYSLNAIYEDMSSDDSL